MKNLYKRTFLISVLALFICCCNKEKKHNSNPPKKANKYNARITGSLLVGTAADLTGAPAGTISNFRYDNTDTNNVVLANMFRENYMGNGIKSPQGLENYMKLSGGSKGYNIGIISSMEWSGSLGTATELRGFESAMAMSSTGKTTIDAVKNYFACVSNKSGLSTGLTIKNAYQFYADAFGTNNITYGHKYSFYAVKGAGGLHVADNSVFGGTLSAVLPHYSYGTDLPVIYNSTNNRFETGVASPQIVAGNDLKALTEAKTISSFKTAGTATFNISAYLNIITITDCSIQIQVNYTDENNVVQRVSFAATDVTGNSTYNPITIRVKEGTLITVKSDIAANTGSITYDAGARILKM